jgi:hypothetical protein
MIHERTLKKKAGTKIKNWNFRGTKIRRKILKALKIKFSIFRGTKNLLNPKLNNSYQVL